MFYTHQLQKADVLSVFLSSSFSCFFSFSLSSASFCFLYLSLSRWSWSRFHFSNTCNNYQMIIKVMISLNTERLVISSMVLHNRAEAYLLSRLLSLFFLFPCSLFFSGHGFLFFGFCFETFYFPFFPGLI